MIQQFLYPTDIAVSALGLKPNHKLLQWDDQACKCSHCAQPINYGDYYEPTKVTQFFSDTRSLHIEQNQLGRAVICWRCHWLRKMPALYGFGAALTTPTGMYPIHKDIHKAWAFTTPPQGPLVITCASAKMQHLIWRAQVTLDSSLLNVRYGPHQFVVRPELIRQALDICDQLNHGQQTWRSPLILDRKMEKSNIGHLTKFGTQALSAEQAQLLSSLHQGEYWALSFLMHSKRPKPEQPEPIHHEISAKLNK